MNVRSKFLPSTWLLCSALSVTFACDRDSQAEAAPSVAGDVIASAAAAEPAAAAKLEPVDARAASAANEVISKFDPTSLTTAPVRTQMTARLDAPVAEVWAYVSDNDNLVEYAGSVGIQHVELDDSKADADGVGVVRECTAMGDKHFVEKVVYTGAPHVFAYSAVENPMGLNDHLGVIIVRPAAGGTTELEWRQHFNAADPKAQSSMDFKVKMMTMGILRFFTTKYGGEMVS